MDVNKNNSFFSQLSIQKLASQPTQGKIDNKYNPFRLYKWTIIIFNIALLYEMVIVIGFWLIILPGIMMAPADSSHSADDYSEAFLIVAGGLDHSVPMVVLVIEFCINCIPITWRHFIITFIIGLIYLMMNMVYSLDVAEVYPVLDWKSTLGITLPILLMMFTIIMEKMLMVCFKKKLKANGKHYALD